MKTFKFSLHENTDVKIFMVLHRSRLEGVSSKYFASNEYPQHMFSWRNKKNINIFGLKKASYQGPCIHSKRVNILIFDEAIPLNTQKISFGTKVKITLNPYHAE